LPWFFVSELCLGAAGWQCDFAWSAKQGSLAAVAGSLNPGVAAHSEENGAQERADSGALGTLPNPRSAVNVKSSKSDQKAYEKDISIGTGISIASIHPSAWHQCTGTPGVSFVF
jgi:hypothetical protein